MKKYIAPSVLGSDLSNLTSECTEVLQYGSDWLHLDIMDGHFVPNLSFGPPVVKCLRKNLPTAYFDCHLMVNEPLKWIEPLSAAGATRFTFHIETISSYEALVSIINSIKAHNMIPGIAIKPSTAISELLLQGLNSGIIEFVLIMTVEPGFGGQAFISNTMEKVEYLRRNYERIDIEVDGGVNSDTIIIANTAGANVFVLGTFVFNSFDRQKTINNLRNLIS